MLDTITGLPVHALVVHAVVVGLPVMALVTLLAASRPAWRSRLSLVFAGNAVVLVLCLVARMSGQQLQARLQQFAGPQVASTHGREGAWLWAFAAGLLVSGLLAWWAAAARRGTALAAALVFLTAAAAIGATVVVGDSGARAVWEQTIQNTHPG